jgi:hypothetical protein
LGHETYLIFGPINQPHFETFKDVFVVVVHASLSQVLDIEVSIFGAYNHSLTPPSSHVDTHLALHLANQLSQFLQVSSLHLLCLTGIVTPALLT